jgi:adenosylhomocysteine nucleosidase
MKLGIIAALHGEISQLLADMAPGATRQHIAMRDYYTGKILGQDCIVVLARVGKVAAAATATALIERFGASQIIFTGVAGGVAHGLNIGDVIIANELVQHDLDARPFFGLHEIPMLGVSRCHADQPLALRLEAAARQYLEGPMRLEIPAATRGRFGLDAPRVHHGLIASGDQFIGSAARVQALRNTLPDVLAVEMEGAAVAQVCHEYGVPFSVIRTLSDTADDQAHIDFPAFLNEVASLYSHGILRAFLAQPHS